MYRQLRMSRNRKLISEHGVAYIARNLTQKKGCSTDCSSLLTSTRSTLINYPVTTIKIPWAVVIVVTICQI